MSSTKSEGDLMFGKDTGLPYIKTKFSFLRVVLFLVNGFQQQYTMLHVLLFGFIFSPLRLISLSLYQKLESLAWTHGAKLHIFMTNLLVGIPTYIYGDYEGGIAEGRKVVISNHCSSADWLIQLSTAGRNSEGALRFFLKMVKNFQFIKAHSTVPVAGWACQLHGFHFNFLKKRHGTFHSLILFRFSSPEI
jgi:hypothetical protein